MMIYKGWKIPETKEEVEIKSIYEGIIPSVQLRSEDDSQIVNISITLEDLQDPKFTMSELIDEAKFSIDMLVFSRS